MYCTSLTNNNAIIFVVHDTETLTIPYTKVVTISIIILFRSYKSPRFEWYTCWTDSNGRSCGWYQGTGPNNRCKDFGNKYNGGMGTANENCCYCMLQLTQMPSTKPTTSPNPTSTNSLIPLGPLSPASQPTLGYRNSFKNF